MINALIRGTAVFALTLLPTLTQAQPCSDLATLRVAFIPQEANQTEDGRYEGLIATLRDELARSITLVHVDSYGAVIEGRVDGTIDLAELGPGSYAIARDKGADITAFASMSRDSTTGPPSVYSSVLITLRDAGFRNIDDFRGASLSLVDPASTSGALVPRLFVQRATSKPLETWFGRVSFAGSHDRSIEAVLHGRVDAAFVSDTKLRHGQHDGQPAEELVDIIWRSAPIPSDPYAYQRSLCEPLKQAIRRTFFERQASLQTLLTRRRMIAFVPVTDEAYHYLMSKMMSKTPDN